MSVFDEKLSAYISGRRWFAGKGRDFMVSHVSTLPWLSQTPRVRIEVVTVRYEDGTHDSYQVPIAYLDERNADYGHALIGEVDDHELGATVAYDAVYLKEASSVFLTQFHERADDGTVAFKVVDGAELPERGSQGTVMTAEQSNTSIAYGEDAILKLFRRISAGFNPDIEIHEALTRRSADHVAPLLGWIDGAWVDSDGARHQGHLGMLQVFLRTASDGWALALASVRDLLVEEDLRADEVGGDFAAEAERLGAATASIHVDLAELFTTGQATPQQISQLGIGMRTKLNAAICIVPELEDYAGPLRTAYDALGSLTAPVPVQRIHGDLHLGQTLRTAKGWKIIDFEGEPAQPLSERLGLVSPLRDVAGMLRSFDYAAGATRQNFGGGDQLRYRAEEWIDRNQAAFLAGYSERIGIDVAQHHVLLRAYEADKAVYEAVYEARNRPTWLTIPLSAIERFAAEAMR
ncbi:MAG: aminoglycoside phosphotransferase [Propionibacteriales bacterium]|nr:aminoglycoside phosphotransferase [Propionibacteriales bacterium]